MKRTVDRGWEHAARRLGVNRSMLGQVLGVEGSGCARAASSALTRGAAARCSPQLQLHQKREGWGRAAPATALCQFHRARVSAGASELPGGSEEAWLWWWCFSPTLKSLVAIAILACEWANTSQVLCSRLKASEAAGGVGSCLPPHGTGTAARAWAVGGQLVAESSGF